MASLMQRLRGVFGAPPHAVAEPAKSWLDFPNQLPEPWVEIPAVAAAAALPEGTPCDDALRAAIEAEIMERRRRTDTLHAPPIPTMTGLVVRRDGLPDWWASNGNLMLCAPDALKSEIVLGMRPMMPRGAIVMLGADAQINKFQCVGDGVLAAIGDRAKLTASTIAMSTGATVLIGEETTATWLPLLTAHNRGIIIVGADGMWAPGVNFMTDDSHAIREVDTDRRINRLGGRIVVEPHVWLGQQVQLMGDCWIGHDGVIGQGSFVKGAMLPPHAVSVGRPARPRKHGITWSRDDLP